MLLEVTGLVATWHWGRWCGIGVVRPCAAVGVRMQVHSGGWLTACKHFGICATVEGIAFCHGSGAGLAITLAIITLETARKAARPHG